MRLLSLSLRNFKGTRKLDLEPKGGDITVYGDNATGKTTIMDAALWLLFGKDSANRADYNIKTLDASGEVAAHGVDHSVAGTFELPDGTTLTLKRTYREVWTKKRGAAKETFSGHQTSYEVNGVPCGSKKEYDAAVTTLADEKLFRLLSDPLYFNTGLKWEERRTILLFAFGNIRDEDVIAANPELKELPAILNGKSPEDYKKIVEARRREVQKELDAIPIRIDEVREGMPSLPTGSRESWAEAVEAQRALLEAAREERLAITSGGAVAEKRRQIAEVDARLRELEVDIRSAAEAAAREARRTADAARERAEKAERSTLGRLQEERARTLEKRRQLEALLVESRAAYAAIRGTEYEPPALDENCPTCGQPLPPAKVQEARDKAEADWKADRAKKLHAIREDGHRYKAEVEKADNQLADLDAAIEEASAEHARLQQEAEVAAHAAAELSQAIPDPNDDAAYQEVLAEKERLQEEVRSLSEGNAAALEEVDKRIQDLTVELRKMETDAAAFARVEEAEARVASLSERGRELSAAYQEAESHIFLLETFTRAKVELLDAQINAHFSLARFRLFEEQINGGLKDTCITTMFGVPYDSLNHGARLNVGLDIINTLAAHYGFAPPVFIDNAESVTSILPTEGQAIKLVVSAKDSTLRVEYQEEVAA